MATRDEVYAKFGPKLLEAIQLYNLETMKLKLKDREAITQQQALDRIEEICLSIPDYDWMGEE